PSNGRYTVPAATDTVELSLFSVLDTFTASGIDVDFTNSTINFTGASVTGLPGGSAITDATGNFGFLGSAGALSATGLTTISLSGGTNSAVSFASAGTGTLAVRSATGTATYGDGTGTQVFSGSGGLSYSGVTSLDLDCSAALQINSSGSTISIGNDAVNQNINVATGGTRTVSIGSATATLNWDSSGGASTLTINNANAVAWRVYDGTTNLLVVNTLSDALSLQLKLTQGQGSNATPQYIGFEAVAGEALTAGDVVCIQNDAGTPKIYKADATTSTNKYLIAGICGRTAAVNGDPTIVATGLVSATFAAAPAAADNGVSYVYLSETAGQATLTAPTASGSTVMRLGVLYGGNGADTTVRVLWQPVYVGANP
ncbi:MAG: hypothetical protein EBU84_21140, partial [Actinobacteria bacterium]|nr:hypothetical protein [Actinomycetota bacterium]